MLEVVRAGPLTTVQDLGRPGWAHLGVPRSGALDEPALRLANHLVGNPPGSGGLEITLGGFAARFDRPAIIAVAGAAAPVLVDGVDQGGLVEQGGAAGPIRVPAGARVDVRTARRGLRCYLAVDGGIVVPPVLGSRSTDTLSGLGPPVLQNGVSLPLGDPPSPDPSGPGLVGSPATGAPLPEPGAAIRLGIRFGPRADWFTAAAHQVLLDSTWTLTPQSNRIGARLSGPALARAVPDELPSEGVVLGAVQVPTGGQPLVFLADHPTTGGYPVIAVVDQADLSTLAQARPGATVRFHGPQQ